MSKKEHFITEDEAKRVIPHLGETEWCACRGIGQCMGCRIETIVYQYHGTGGLAFLKSRLRPRGSAKAQNIVKYKELLCRKTGEPPE